MANPIMVASGTFGYAREMAGLVDLDRLGGIVPKTITWNPREGNPPPRTVETAAGMLNSIGLDNDGVEAFIERFPDAEQPNRPGVQMPAFHHRTGNGDGVSLVNIGVGPANAKTITDHVAVLRPDTMMMIGHCGGLRNHQALGDFVLATSYLRADHVLDEILPTSVPIIPNHLLNSFLLDALVRHDVPYRLGIVHTTDNRNWELNQGPTLAAMRAARSVAVDMESATIATNGFRYRIPNATLLCVSDKPLHASPKQADSALAFYEASKRVHLDLALECIDRVRRDFPGGLPNNDIRAPDEPLFGAETPPARP